MPTPEELEQQRLEAEKQINDAAAQAAAAAKKPLVLDGDDIPEAFRGKPAKEFVDTLLNTSLEVEKLKKALAERESEIQKAKTPPKTELSEEEIEAQKEKELLARPIKYLDKHLDERLKPLTQSYFETQAATTRELMSRKLKGFDKLAPKIDEYVSKVPPEARINPQVWEGAWKLARLDDLDARETELNTKLGLHSETGEVGRPPKSPTKVELTDEERMVARKFGLSEEDYIKYQKNAEPEDFT